MQKAIRAAAHPEIFHRIAAFARKNTVLVIAVIAATITAVIIPPDGKYADYFDFKTLTCLFSMLAVVCALRNIRFFTIIAQKIIERFANLRLCVTALVYITFIGSMFIANDMALLTFLPLGGLVMTLTGKQKHMAYVFILQNIAANLGGMVTPFGNPQNLYLYSKYNIDTLKFTKIMLPSFLLAVAMITAACMLIRPEPLSVDCPEYKPLPAGRTALYLALFALSIVMVFRVIPFYIGGAAILAVMLFADRDALKKVDYPLLLTFCAFFIFAGNMSRIGAVRDFFTAIPEKYTLLYSVASCQFISNVPSAVLLSQFTGNYADLLVGVNIGGTGTLIASLASLITFREYSRRNDRAAVKRYIGLFSAMNFGFLAILTLFSWIIR